MLKTTRKPNYYRVNDSISQVYWHLKHFSHFNWNIVHVNPARINIFTKRRTNMYMLLEIGTLQHIFQLQNRFECI